MTPGAAALGVPAFYEGDNLRYLYLLIYFFYSAYSYADARGRRLAKMTGSSMSEERTAINTSKKSETKAPDKKTVMEYLDQFNMPHSSLGFSYLVEAIILVCGNGREENKRRVMSLYDEIAEQHNTTPARVERSIRTLLNRVACNKTNGQFIYYSADRLLYGFGGN